MFSNIVPIVAMPVFNLCCDLSIRSQHRLKTLRKVFNLWSQTGQIRNDFQKTAVMDIIVSDDDGFGCNRQLCNS